MGDLQVGESYTREGLPDEVLLRLIRRADAEQNKHVNLARIADSLDTLSGTWSDLTQQLQRVADALQGVVRDQALPPEDEKLPDVGPR